MTQAMGDVMRKRIQDEFTHLRVSRQRKYQLRMQRDKRCTECGRCRPRRTLLGAVFDVNNPMKVGEEPVGIPAGERDSGRANPRSEPCRSRDS
jgi:hypothetical protein